MPTTWAEQPLEELLRERLNSLPGTAGQDLFSDYVSARRYVTEEVVEHIAHTEPDLTDHGARHLADVMRRASELLVSHHDQLTPEELYILCVSILFHDVGNLHGRRDHQRKISGIYAQARGTDARFKGERNAVLAIAGAHTGSTSDGSHDTLKDLNHISFQGTAIRARELAAILRLSDELAEGEHRTSAYLRNIGAYAPSSVVYHTYADVTDYSIQGNGGRIAITYTVDLELSAGIPMVGTVSLSSLLELCYKRIVKLDQERRYCKHYCTLLSSFAETWAYFHFYHQGQPVGSALDPIVLSDLVVPGTPTATIEQLDARYGVSELVGRLADLCQDGVVS
jgi:hypothetical protein